MTIRAISVALTLAGIAFAQLDPDPKPTPAPTQTPDSTQTPPATATGPNSQQWKALSVTDKLRYDGRHLFDVENLVFAAIGASFDQWRDHPSQWGEGWDPLAERYASHIGQYLVQRSIMFPVQAIDHEDTRYFRSTRTSIKGRIGDAFLHTVWRHSDSGGMMPAYSEFLGDYGAAAVSRVWWPNQYHTGSAIFIAGSDTVLVDAGINVFREFTPDIKRWLHISR